MEMFPETSGTAALSGRDLPPAAALAADKHLTALAQALKATGIPGTLDTLRARAYLHLLTGQPAATLILPTASPGPPGHHPRPGPGTSPAPAAQHPAAPHPAAQHPAAQTRQHGPGRTLPGPGPGPGPGSLPGLSGSVNLTMPLAAWLGWTESPGDIPGYGPLDAGDSRALASLLAQRPRQPVVRHPHQTPPGTPSPTPAPATDPQAHPSTWPPPANNPAPALHPAPARAPARHPARAREPTPVRGTRPPDPQPPPHRRTGSAASPSPPCKPAAAPTPANHPATSPAAALRHLIQIRNPACTAPGCRRPAARCDLDHITPYHRGGKTCECNLGPACRHDHQRKQTPGWTLTTPAPGTFTWTTPGNRTHTTTPAQYPD